jgi:TonB-dependent starch-binding outer membrane protein SusC
LNVWDNSGKLQFQGLSTQNWNFRRDFLDRWTKPGDQARYPRLYYNQLYPGLSRQSDFSSSMFMYEGDYLRMRELTLAYRLPAKLLEKLKLSAARIYATGFNLFLWTKYPNGDPEVNRDADGGQTDRNMSPNVTYLTPPQARTFTFGINVSF